MRALRFDLPLARLLACAATTALVALAAPALAQRVPTPFPRVIVSRNASGATTTTRTSFLPRGGVSRIHLRAVRSNGVLSRRYYAGRAAAGSPGTHVHVDQRFDREGRLRSDTRTFYRVEPGSMDGTRVQTQRTRITTGGERRTTVHDHAASAP